MSNTNYNHQSNTAPPQDDLRAPANDSLSGSNISNSVSNNKKSSSHRHHSSSKMNPMRPIKQSVKSVTKAARTLLPNSDDYRWEELQSIEKRRRQILLRVEEPTWKVLTHWDGTVLRILAVNPLLYATMIIYVVMRFVVREGDNVPEFMGSLTSDSMTVLGGFLSFFLVFYVNQNHKRFFGLYKDSMGFKGRIFDVATLAVTTLPFAQATRLVRYMNAAHAAGYVGLSDIYPSQSYFNHIDNQLGLLTKEERQRLDAIDLDAGGSCNRELIVWCMNEIQTARRKGLLDPELANQFREQILQLRAKIGQLYNAKDLPIPFFYVHFICLLTTMYLPLFAVTAAIEAGTGDDIYWAAGLIKGMVVLLQAIFVLGLRILGQKMSDPYGDDLIDLSVMFYVNFTWTHSQRILKSHFPEEASAAVESDLWANRPQSVGKAWEPEKETPSARASSSSSANSGGDATDTHSTAMHSIALGGETVDSNVILNPRLGDR